MMSDYPRLMKLLLTLIDCSGEETFTAANLKRERGVYPTNIELATLRKMGFIEVRRVSATSWKTKARRWAVTDLGREEARDWERMTA